MSRRRDPQGDGGEVMYTEYEAMWMIVLFFGIAAIFIGLTRLGWVAVELLVAAMKRKWGTDAKT